MKYLFTKEEQMAELLCAFLALLAPLGIDSCYAQESSLDSPAVIARIVDGDTLVVKSPSQNSFMMIRLLGIDTPEIQGHCKEETVMAAQAKKRLSQLIPYGATVTLISMPGGWTTDPYGRILAGVKYGGRDIAMQLVQEGLARRWAPPAPRIDWCGGR
jgi:endonuclease YncB( thermonuclease family)